MKADSPLTRPEDFQGEFREDIEARAVYSEAAGIGRVIPRAVAVPRDPDDVVALVRWASQHSLSLIPRGSGTSMAGGAIGPGVVVDLSEMNAIGSVDAVARRIRTGPGALRSAVNAVAAEHGLRFPVDPSSGEYCTVGGMAATNAAGAHSLLFGSTRRWVTALDCVFADGSRARITRGDPAPLEVPAVKRFLDEARSRIFEAASDGSLLAHRGVRKDSSGYALRQYAESAELIDLLVGSEGTLAIIVGLELELTDLPGATSGVLGAFSSLDDAVTAAGKARELGAAACELLDRTFLEIAGGATPTGADSDRASSTYAAPTVAALSSLPGGTEAVLLAEVEGETAESAARLAEEMAAAFRESGATTVTLAFSPGEQHEIWELRHAASPILSRLDPALKSMQFIEDGAVPSNRLAEYVLGVRAALDRHGVKGVIFGHAGDAHIHVNPLIDVSAPDWRATIEGLLDDVVALTSRLDGTLSGEHGDGSLRAPLLAEVWPAEAIDLFAAVKYCFDPEGILNPGVKVPVAGQRAIADVKYDPALEALPEAARTALDFVSSERAYATSRLSLIDRAG
jgi:FAD/FMN-containing dehydrogenase